MEGEPNMRRDLYNHIPVFVDRTSQLLSVRETGSSSYNQTFYDGLLNQDNLNHQQPCLGGTSFGSGSLTTVLASRNRPNSSIPLQEGVTSDSLRAMYSSSGSYGSSSSIPSSLICGYDILVGDVNNKWDQNRFLMHPDMEPAHVQFSDVRDADDWGLSLATTGPSFNCHETIQDQCSDMSYSCVFDGCQSQRRVGHCDKELSLGRASSSQSLAISGSRYHSVLQQILSEVASYSLDSVGQTSYCVGDLMNVGSSAPFSSDKFGTDECRVNEGSIDVPAGRARRKQKVESKKSQLLSLLQAVDDQYNRCLDEIHTVISAFHAASELDPNLHASFALQTVSFFYKSLRQRISNQILEMGMESEVSGDSIRSFEKSFIQKQWALQQLKKKDQQQLWRPQRGLPERSVSVLRAWMFDNFLHPYPKDAEKHLLAIKSGLSRSQVSNWFINARVRLWKPLVEEMCSELNRRKSNHQNEDGSNDNNNRSSQLSIYDFNQRFNNNITR
ncbi:hypothetical protein RND81_03G143500 [Saponaria officinalis]|uniref:Homeobox domain-containing protein n=1 Tax=Saponaria officinalis TaxID=3572 RepID=A0AAW1MAR7_SAPOF